MIDKSNNFGNNLGSEDNYFREIRLCVDAQGIPMSKGRRRSLRKTIISRHKLKPKEERILQHELQKHPFEAIELTYDGFRVEERIVNERGIVKPEVHFGDAQNITITDPSWIDRYINNPDTFIKWLNDVTYENIIRILNGLNDRYHQLIREEHTSQNINTIAHRYSILLAWRKHFRRWYSSNAYPIPTYAWDILGTNPNIMESRKDGHYNESSSHPVQINVKSKKNKTKFDALISGYLETVKKNHDPAPSPTDLEDITGIPRKIWSQQMSNPFYLIYLLKELKAKQGWRYSKTEKSKMFWKAAQSVVEDLTNNVGGKTDIYSKKQAITFKDGRRVKKEKNVMVGYDEEVERDFGSNNTYGDHNEMEE